MSDKIVHELYASFDPEKLGADDVTLCMECAKHPSLKRFVELHAIDGPVCGVCQEIGYPYKACAPVRKRELSKLIKALIRFYYNEYEYNHHWGGDYGPERLLVNPNPILENASSATRTRIPERTHDFLYALLSAEPYPPIEEGISVYAGHDDGVRGMNLALKGETSPILRSYVARLANQNHFDIEPDLLGFLDELSDRMTRVVSAGTRFFRARIGVEARYADHSDFGWRRSIVRQPYRGTELSAPPPPLASGGRLNRAGVSFLYLASDAATAAAEVRPHPGHYLSIGEFECLQNIRIASLDAGIMQYAGNEHELELFHFLYSADQLMATPVPPEKTARYSITQLIADCLRRKGFEGVSFRSSIGVGNNLCIFKPEWFAPVDGSEVVQRVKSLAYELAATPMILEPNQADHFRLDE
ncbi:RES domain protein [Rhodopseudomonas palustris TIE-1]|uniref:RES family NAD+ phosphorylase n=1 Tax=Rhodopseudomonas palustris TaxID=1076 RepID=UPI00017796C4|nr:RES family NAD+ phosphorylase [Rhodopseudomonas palustris]ACF00451.1 RES domain protein [Rhodopseudomonas palustris TIE-1]